MPRSSSGACGRRSRRRTPPLLRPCRCGASTRTLVDRSRRAARGAHRARHDRLAGCGLPRRGPRWRRRRAGRDASAASRPRTPPLREASATTASAPDGAALNAHGFALVQAGDFESALPILRQAVLALRGHSTLTEAYASYTSPSRGSPSAAATASRAGRSFRGDPGPRAEIDELCATDGPAAALPRARTETKGATGRARGAGRARTGAGTAGRRPSFELSVVCGSRSRTTSPSSGNRPGGLLRVDERPVGKHVELRLAPGVASPRCRGSVSSAARLAARVSYPLQVGQ